jgi:hypothetical protein
MKKLLIGLSILTSMSSFAELTSETSDKLTEEIICDAEVTGLYQDLDQQNQPYTQTQKLESKSFMMKDNELGGGVFEIPDQGEYSIQVTIRNYEKWGFSATPLLIKNDKNGNVRVLGAGVIKEKVKDKNRTTLVSNYILSIEYFEVMLNNKLGGSSFEAIKSGNVASGSPYSVDLTCYLNQ